MLFTLAATLLLAQDRSGLIAFVGSKAGQIDLFTVRPDGTDLRQITNDPLEEMQPVWSPNGRRIAYLTAVRPGQAEEAGTYLNVVDADGTNRIRLAGKRIHTFQRVAWSPDGTRLAYVETPIGARARIMLVSSTGSTPTPLRPAKPDEEMPYWGVDGRIYFTAHSTSQPAPGIYQTEVVGIVSMNPDGSGERVVLPRVAGTPRISPDGNKLLYWSLGKLGTAKMDGTGVREVGRTSGTVAQWTPDGSHIVYLDESFALTVVTPDGTPQPIEATRMARAATLSPDGKKAAFVKAITGGEAPYGLFLVDLASGVPQQVPLSVSPVVSPVGGSQLHLHWSPTAEASAPSSPTPTSPTNPTGTTQAAPGLGSGFPGTPVGPDRDPSPFGTVRAYGMALKLSAPTTVTVGDAFFAPVPLDLSITQTGELANKPVAFTVSGLPPGVTGSIQGTGPARKLKLGGLSSLSLGDHTILVKATSGTTSTTAPIRIVRKQARILLVDDDREGNNAGLDKDPAAFLKGSLSKSDAFYRAMLERGNGARSLIYDTVGADMYGNGPDVEKMQPYDLVVWYLGTQYGGNPDGTAVFSGTDESNIRAYLQEGGGRTILMVGPGYVSRVAKGTPTSATNDAHWTETDSTFLKSAMGVQGGRGLQARFIDADLSVNGQTFMMGKGPLEAQLSPINPSTSTALVTAELDPDRKGKRQVPVAVWNRVGDANLIYVGFTLENVAVRQDRLAGLLLGIRIPGMDPR